MERCIPFNAAVALGTLAKTELASTAVVGLVSRYSFSHDVFSKIIAENPTIKEVILKFICLDL
jgi:hypothetical protein